MQRPPPRKGEGQHRDHGLPPDDDQRAPDGKLSRILARLEAENAAMRAELSELAHREAERDAKIEALRTIKRRDLEALVDKRVARRPGWTSDVWPLNGKSWRCS